MNGYGLVMLFYPDVPMPAAAISRDELIEMIQEYDNAEAERVKRRGIFRPGCRRRSGRQTRDDHETRYTMPGSEAGAQDVTAKDPVCRRT